MSISVTNPLIEYDFTQKWSEQRDENNKDVILLTEISSKNEKEIISKQIFTQNLFTDNEIINLNFELDNKDIICKLQQILSVTQFDDILSIMLLKMQNFVVIYLSKYSIQNNNFDKSFLIPIVTWLYNTSIHLSNRLNLSVYVHELENIKISTHIPRCSYKFCHLKNQCNYNYGENSGGCYADHYVHNLVAADCNALMIYVETHYTDNNFIQNAEIRKCISTICFAINHMFDELNNVCMYNQNNSDIDYNKFHKNNKKNSNKPKIIDHKNPTLPYNYKKSTIAKKK